MFKGISRIFIKTTWNTKLSDVLPKTRCFSVPPLQTASRDTEPIPILNNKDGHKIYEIRTYCIYPKDFKTFIKLTEENFHLRTKHSKLFGFWSTELGGMNEVVHIWEYDGHEHRAKVRQAIANDSEWQNDFIQKAAPMWKKQNNATMMLLPWSIVTLPNKTGVYELQVFSMNSHTDIWDGRLKAAMELSSIKLKQSNSILVGCFTTIFGQHNTVYALWQHESFDKYSLGRLQLLSDTNKSVLHAFYHEVLTGYSKGLLPNKVSPLQ